MYVYVKANRLQTYMNLLCANGDKNMEQYKYIYRYMFGGAYGYLYHRTENRENLCHCLLIESLQRVLHIYITN